MARVEQVLVVERKVLEQAGIQARYASQFTLSFVEGRYEIRF